MTTAAELVDIVIAQRATISLDGERVIITETGPVIAADLRSDLRAHREAIASFLRMPLGTIALWRAGWATLNPDIAPCPGFRADNWRGVHRVASRFLDPKASPLWCALAIEQGWTLLDLFAVHRQVGAVRGDCTGSLLSSGGLPVVVVATHAIRFQSGLAAYRRHRMDEALCVPIWKFGSSEDTPRRARSAVRIIDGAAMAPTLKP